jgi:Zn-dependent protease
MWAELLVWYLVFVLSTTCHEFAHAVVGRLGGDRTAEQEGLLTLDPTVHIRRSPAGMLAIPIVSYLWMGWMVGWASVPYDPHWGRRHPLRSALMSLAGPAANFLLAGAGIVALRLLLDRGLLQPPADFDFSFSRVADAPEGAASYLGALAKFLSVLVNLNILLGCFNLLPLPPLDGSGVVEGLSPRRAGMVYDYIRSQPIISMSATLLAWALIQPIATPALVFALKLLYPGLFG